MRIAPATPGDLSEAAARLCPAQRRHAAVLGRMRLSDLLASGPVLAVRDEDGTLLALAGGWYDEPPFVWLLATEDARRKGAALVLALRRLLPERCTTFPEPTSPCSERLLHLLGFRPTGTTWERG